MFEDDLTIKPAKHIVRHEQISSGNIPLEKRVTTGGTPPADFKPYVVHVSDPKTGAPLGWQSFDAADDQEAFDKAPEAITKFLRDRANKLLIPTQNTKPRLALG